MQSTTSSTRTFITPAAAESSKSGKPAEAKRRLRGRSILPWLITLMLAGASSFLYLQYRSAQQQLTGSNSTVSSLIAKVRKLVVLPATETPTVATVVHADKLHSQNFFVNAQDGDKVLVYSREKEAILYRPRTNQVVTIAPVTVTPTGSNLAGQQ